MPQCRLVQNQTALSGDFFVFNVFNNFASCANVGFSTLRTLPRSHQTPVRKLSDYGPPTAYQLQNSR